MNEKKLKAVFVDRDGVLNTHLPGAYVQNPQMLTVLANAAQAVRRLNRAGVPVIIISNQQGVGKGLMTQADLDAVDKALKSEMEASAGAQITASYYCPHRAEENCDCRKPKAGLIVQALRDFQIDPTQTAFVGDSQTDMQAASTAGVGDKILVLSGATKSYHAGQFSVEPDNVFSDLSSAVDWLLATGMSFQ